MKKTVTAVLTLAIALAAFTGCTSNDKPVETTVAQTTTVAAETTTSASDTKYKDGEYKAELSIFQNGWKDYIVLDIKGDVVTVKEFDSISEKDNAVLKSKQTAAEYPMDPLPSTFIPQLIENFTKANGDLEAMEGVAGATSTSNNFKLLIGSLLSKNAVEGITETLIVEAPEKTAADDAADKAGDETTKTAETTKAGDETTKAGDETTKAA